MPRYQLTPEDRRKGGLARAAQQRAAALARRATDSPTRDDRGRSVKRDFHERDLPKGYKWKFDKHDFSTHKGREKSTKDKPGKTYVETEYIIKIRKKGSDDVSLRKGVVRMYGETQSDLLRTILATNGDIDSGEIDDIWYGDVDDWLYDDLEDFDYGRYGMGGEE